MKLDGVKINIFAAHPVPHRHLQALHLDATAKTRTVDEHFIKVTHLI